MVWNEIKNGMTMGDGSVVTQRHNVHPCETIEIFYGKQNKSIIVSEDHIILCDISKMKRKNKKECFEISSDKRIPIESEMIIYTDEVDITAIENGIANGDINPDDYIHDELVVKDESKIKDIKKGLVWLTALEIRHYVTLGEKIYSNGNRIKNTVYCGVNDCFCISTDTGKYEIEKGGLIHHNSVTIRNIIFHALTHDIKIGLVDLKITEFESYKGNKNVIGVCNTEQETVELLRLCRQLMYKRNKELAKAGVVNLLEYVPKDPSENVIAFGREYNGNEKCVIKEDDGTEREITMNELLELLEGGKQ